MLKLIHAADFHLDSPFSGLSPEHAARRRQEQRDLLTRLVQLARTRQADLVLLAGDLFDSAQTYRETIQEMIRTLSELSCPVVIAPGNHDFYGPQSPYAGQAWPENVHIFTSDAVQAIPFPELNCTVYGRAFVMPQQSTSPLSSLQVSGPGLAIGVFHGDVSGGMYGPMEPDEIAASGLHYLALGHVHQCSGLQQTGKTFWAYPGCPEGRGFDELGDKGVLAVELDEQSCRAEFVPLGLRRYQSLSVDVTEAEDPTGIVSEALAGMQEDICRVFLTGERGTQPLDLRRMERVLAPLCYGLTLLDSTRMSGDLWERAEEDTLTGLFLREMRLRLQADPDNKVLQQAVRFGLAALEHGEDVAL